MSKINISRRLFVGASVYFVATPVWASIFNTVNSLSVFSQNGRFFTAKEMTILSDVADIMIPRTDTPGATDAKVIDVLDALMLSWAGSETKQQYKFIIKQIDLIAQSSFKVNYQSASRADRELLLNKLDQLSFDERSTELSKSYRKLKEMIFHIFYTSEEANPNFMLVPGTYRGDIIKEEVDAYNEKGRTF
ncbi:gluconate 2-dehydrogenase subunit 3 family protein [Pseudoalteromonas undina]|uniref:Gluconate 2-dehydrogenase subunit 3 family protein n=1 Tax=Pseudoalteromonas undina TaxID=43660 RepID=A0ACC6R329_9GAMM